MKYSNNINSIRLIAKKVICFFRFDKKLKTDYREARQILTAYSEKPKGHCFSNNKKSIKYDIQIIIPAYNVKKYINKCLQSLKPILTSEKKVIIQIIDDGSTDGTGTLIDTFSRYFSGTIIVIHQNNKGLSEARNVGLNNICGEYIMFLDSDDFFPNDFNLDECFRNVDKCDVLQGEWLIVNMEGVETGRRKVNKLSGFAWGKLYHHSVFSNLHFPEGYWFEDTIIKFIISRIASQIICIDECICCHRNNPNGISSIAKNHHKAIDTYWITELCIKELPYFGIEYDQESLDRLLHQSLVNQNRIRKMPRRIRKAVFLLTLELTEKYFQGIKSYKYRRLESTIRNKHFFLFEFLSMVDIIKGIASVKTR